MAKRYTEHTYRENKIVEYEDDTCTAFFSKYDVDDEHPNIENKDFDNLLDAQTWIDGMLCS